MKKEKKIERIEEALDFKQRWADKEWA